MPALDARTRNKISLNPSKVLGTSIPSRLVPRILLSNVLFVFAVHASKEWLLTFDVGVFWVLMRVFACGGLGVLVWEGLTGQSAKRGNIEWSVLGTASVLQFVRYGCLFTAIYRLSSPRVILFAHFSTYWMGSFVGTSSTRKGLAVGAAIFVSILSDTQLSAADFWHIAPGYGALLLHAFSSSALEHTLSVLSPSLGTTFSTAASILGATVVTLPFYLFRTVVLDFPPTPVLPLISLACLPIIAYSLLFLTPLTMQSVKQLSFKPQHFGLSFPTLVASSYILGTIAFRQVPTWADLLIASLLYVGMYPENIDTITAVPRTPTSRLVRSYLKTILSNPESRKIFYFLMLNLCYMLVQMLYGVWTNSLGLISDAIHMAFDCMAIGMGLFASVMATWDPNERFTYGYGRIETLSGFANGIFLILISIFIMFEAIQRILEPPEMNTNQLLLVSSLGLGVNLFGMFAMGGHHHHGGGGHSHSHGHSHSSSSHTEDHSGHSHGPVAQLEAKSDHGHSHSISHSHSHSPSPITVSPTHVSHSPTCDDHSHSHSHDKEHSHGDHDHDHEHGHEHDHDHGHGHDHAHEHDHSDHAHDHDHGNDHAHNHDHGHEHNKKHTPPPTEHAHSHSHGEHAHEHASHSPTSPTGHPAHIRSTSSSSICERPTHGDTRAVKRHSRGPSISIDLGAASAKHALLGQLSPPMVTPLTPNYTFGHDEHYTQVHESKHVPNLREPSTGHSHSQEGHSHNMRGVFLHVMADTLGSVGVIISTLLIQFYGWTGFDPIASLFIAILIAASVIPLVMDTGRILALDVSDRRADIEHALAELSSIEGLASYSAARFWPKDASALIGSIHIQLAVSASAHDVGGLHSNRGATVYTRADRVVERVDTLLRKKISGLEELTIQIEGTASVAD